MATYETPSAAQDVGAALGRVFDESVTGMAVVDMDGRFLRVNPAFCRMLGRPAEELTTLRTTDVTHPDDRWETRQVMGSLVGGSSDTSQVRKRYLRADGSVVHVVRTTTVIRDDEGRRTGLFSQVVDVTAAEQTQLSLRQSERRLQALLARANELTVLMGADTRISYASPASQRLLGLPPEALIGASALDFVHPDEVERARRTITENLATPGRSVTEEYRVRHSSGAWRVAEITGTNLVDDPAVRSLVINVTDVTGRRRRERQQAAVAELSGMAVRGGPAGPLMSRTVDLVAEVLGVRHVAVLRREGLHRLRVVARRGPALRDGPFELFAGGCPATLATEALEQDDSVVWSGVDEGGADERRRAPYRALGTRSGAATPIRVDGATFGALSCYSDVPQAFATDDLAFIEAAANVVGTAVGRRRVEARLWRQARTDQLTGLPNRSVLREALASALRRCRDAGDHLAVLFVDADDFKVVNDGLGHLSGDAVVRALAGRIRSVVPRPGLVARFGGDEFVIVSPGCGAGQALGLARRIQEALAEPITLDGRAHTVTASVGVAVTDDPRATPDDLLAEADTAMYAAKRAGKACARVFDAAMRRSVGERLEVSTGLRRAVAADELRLWFQPIVTLEDQQPVGAEALVRWQHPSEGLLGPDRFVPHAEQTGGILPLGRWVLQRACAQAAAWRRDGFDGRVSVNVSARQLVDSDLAAEVATALEATGCPAEAVALEVTESAVMTDLERAAAALGRVRRLGAIVGLDDFGTGHSSLSSLADLPLDFVKIDRSFITRFDDRSRAEALLEAVVELCRGLGLRAVAEGVETAEQLAQLRRLGVERAQGFLFGRPVPAAELVLPTGVG